MSNSTPYKDERSSMDDSIDLHETCDYERGGRPHRRNARSLVTTIVTLIATISLMTNVWLLVDLEKITRLRRPHDPNDSHGQYTNNLAMPYSPADQFKEYQLQSINFRDTEDIYGGPPTDETDQAWSDLLRPVNILMSAEEMRKANKQSIRIHDDEEDETYLGYLEVYHQLHCVKRMVQSRWPERYPDVAALGAFHDAHFNHCIQVLRKGIMCSADTTINTWTWPDANATKMEGVTKPPRKCVNWDRLHDWALSRKAPRDHYSHIYHMDEEGWFGPDN